MGISELWDVLKPAFGERIQFEEFVVRFIDEHGRTPRVAIDGYILIFQSTHSGISVEDESSTIIRNFMAKLFYLVSLNISFVVVFDGVFKPVKNRGLTPISSDVRDYEHELDIFKSSSRSTYGDNSTLIEKIKMQLKQYKIDFVQAPGEGEAECAQLQKFGVVDFVLSGDVDALVFGATKILRNFSKYVDDTSSPIKKNNEISVKYYVTPIDMVDIIRKTGLDRKRLILLASFRGGDYTSGIQRIGIKNSTRLAQCGSAFSANTLKNKKPLPDFSELFLKCFVKDSVKKAFGYTKMNCKKTRQIRLREFTVLLQKTINTRSREIFSRSLTLKDDIFINEYYTLLYLFPIVNERLFIFIPGALSYGDIIEQRSQIMLLDNNFNIQDGSEESVYRTNNLISINDNVGISSIKYTNKNNKVDIESEKFTLLCDEARIEPYCFSNFNYPLKYIIIKLLSDKYYHKFQMLDKLNLDREKIDNKIALIMVKYDIVMLKKVLSNKDINEEMDNPDSPVSKLDYIYIPKKILQIVNPELIQEFDNFIRIKRIKSPSPKKKIPIQKTTLDFFSQFPKSPTKKSLDLNKPDLSKSPIGLGLPFQFNTMPIEQNIHSIQKEYVGIDTSSKTPFKKSIVKKASRKKLLPGQKFVDEFFNKEKVKVKEGSSILESNSNMALFLPEEEEEEEKQIDSEDDAKKFYEQARTSLNIIPKLKINSPKRGIKRSLFSLQDSDKKAKLSNSNSNSPKESNDRDLSIITIDSEVSDTSSIQEIDANTFQFNLSVK